MRKEPHFTPERMLSMLGVKAGSIAPVALISGPRERSQMALESLQERRKIFSFLDLEMHAGTRNGRKVAVGNGGRYAPDTAITTEVLCAAGVEPLIRIGSCGSLQEEIRIGDLVIATGARRGEGTTSYYVPRNFSTVAHPEIVRALTEAAESLKVRYHLGPVFTTDALFQESPELMEEMRLERISAVDMVTSAFLTIAQVRQKKAGAILAVSDECVSGNMGFRDPLFLAAEEKMVEVALKAIDLLG